MAENTTPSNVATGSTPAWLCPGALLCASLIGSLWLGLRPVDRPGPVAALFPPWWGAGESASAAAAAGGTILRFGGWPSIVVAQSQEDDFRDRLRASGAWLLLNPKGAGLCGSRSEQRP